MDFSCSISSLPSVSVIRATVSPSNSEATSITKSEYFIFICHTYIIHVEPIKTCMIVDNFPQVSNFLRVTTSIV